MLPEGRLRRLRPVDFAAERPQRLGIRVGLTCLLSLFLASAGHAIVVCHDYTYYRVTCSNGQCRDANDLPARGSGSLREALTALGYKPFPITTTAVSDPELAGSLLKPGDVLFLRDAHSGFVNANYTIDHFLQLLGQIGVRRSPNDLPRFVDGSGQPGGLFLGDSLSRFLRRPILDGPLVSLEVWRRGSNPAKPQGRAAFALEGTWDATISDPSGTEKLLWQVTSGRSASTIDWSIRTTLLNTTKQPRQQLVGQTWSDGYLEFREDQGKWYYGRNRGNFAFNQAAECDVDPRSITCSGKQGEFNRDWQIKVAATRKDGGGAQAGPVDSSPTSGNQPQTAGSVTPPRRMPRFTAEQVAAIRQSIAYYAELRTRWINYRDQSVAPYLNNGVYYQWARAEYARCDQQIQLAQQWVAYYQDGLRRAGIQ